MGFVYKLIIVSLILMLIGSPTWAVNYKVAVRAHKGIDKSIAQWQATIDVLNQKLKLHTFTLVPIISLDEISLRASKSEFDFVLTNPSSYIEIDVLYGGFALATLINKRANTAQSQFGAVIFTHVKNTHILSIQDLEDKTLMVVSKPAFGGWRVAWLEMLEQGFDPVRRLKSLVFTESRTQPEVVRAVLSGKADAGVVRTDQLERLEAIGKLDMRYLRIINNQENKDFPFFLSTKLYPEWAFAALKHVSLEQAQKVADVLFAISKGSLAAKKGKYIGWMASKNYSEVKVLMQKLKVGPYAD